MIRRIKEWVRKRRLKKMVKDPSLFSRWVQKEKFKKECEAFSKIVLSQDIKAIANSERICGPKLNEDRIDWDEVANVRLDYLKVRNEHVLKEWERQRGHEVCNETMVITDAGKPNSAALAEIRIEAANEKLKAGISKKPKTPGLKIGQNSDEELTAVTGKRFEGKVRG